MLSLEVIKQLPNFALFDYGLLLCAKVAIKNKEYKTARFIINYLEGLNR